MLLNIILCGIGFIVLSYAADKLVEGASNLATNLGVSKLVIGMTIVAAGTSLPEMVVSINASLKGNPELSLGNVVGSNIMNAALILGIAALIQPIVCLRQTIRREVPIMITASFLLWYVAYTDQQITLNEGIIVTILFFAYIYLSFRWSKEESNNPGAELEEESTGEPPASKGTNIAFIIGGLIGLVIGSESLVRGATAIAQSIGVSDEVIGLTLIAIGTSLPELATSIVAARKGHSEITLGNVVGSNIFNIFGIVGCASVVTSFNGVPGSDVLNVSTNMLGIHIPLMVVVGLAVLPIMSTGLKIVRAEGAFLVGLYLAYNVILFQSSSSVLPETAKDKATPLVKQAQPKIPASGTPAIQVIPKDSDNSIEQKPVEPSQKEVSPSQQSQEEVNKILDANAGVVETTPVASGT